MIKTDYPELLKTDEEDAEMPETKSGEGLPGEYSGASIKLSDLNKLETAYDVIDNFAYFPSTGVRMKIVPG